MRIESFIKRLRERKFELENALLTNQVKDFNEYKFLVGRIRGLQDSLDIGINNIKINEDMEE